MADSGSDRLVLTDRRLILFDLTSKNVGIKDIIYSHISSIEQNSVNNVWLFVIGVLLGSVGGVRLINNIDAVSLGLFVVGVVLVGAYYYTKQSGLVFITAADELVYNIQGTESEIIIKEIFKVVRGFK
ncbi:MAG: hypothetical protein OIN89_11190 [Candidatus Methanoperedens sp.]|nr:hypothetical protein [Candidatus Methanoperedens sp.]